MSHLDLKTELFITDRRMNHSFVPNCRKVGPREESEVAGFFVFSQ